MVYNRGIERKEVTDLKKALSIIMASALAAMPLSVNAFAENDKTCGIRDALQKIITVYSDTYDNAQNTCGIQKLVGMLIDRYNGYGCADGSCTQDKPQCENGSCGNTSESTDIWQGITDIVFPENDNQPILPDNAVGTQSSYTNKVIELVNSYRAQNGLGALEYDAAVSCSAALRAKEQEQVFSHTRPNGTSCFTALDDCGVNYRGAGENIAMGQTSAEQVMTDWMNSDGHRENILNPNFTKIGVGLHIGADGRYYWAQMFVY